jgi:DNA-binding FadR family transcriptional regulator
MPESVEKLHRELADFIRAKDDEGLRRVYRELLRTGRSRPEIIDEVI